MTGSRYSIRTRSRSVIDALEPRRMLAASIGHTQVEGLGYTRPFIKRVPEMFEVNVERAWENSVSGGPEGVPGFQIT
ncbi:MAG TPA: hypothetical protein PK402_06835, partial [Tepidisphaeraceae bacterium]|nr:hypothetical protein [Tepidisphaeraceae bacterium]